MTNVESRIHAHFLYYLAVLQKQFIFPSEKVDVDFTQQTTLTTTFKLVHKS